MHFVFILTLLIYFKYVLFYITPYYFYTPCTCCLLYYSLSFNYIGLHSFFIKPLRLVSTFDSVRGGIGAPFATSSLGRLAG